MDMMELYAVTDTFCSGMGRIDILPGGFARFVFYVERDGGKVVVASLIMSVEATFKNRKMIDAILAGTPNSEEAIVSAAPVH